MRITPLEVHNHQFGRSLRGFDRDEVQAFLSLVSEELEQAISDSNRFKDQVAELREQLAESRSREQGFQKAMATADRVAAEIKQTAQREREVLIKEARLKANKLLEQAQTRAVALEDRVNELKMARDRFEHRLRAMLDEHLHLIEQVRDESDHDKIFVLRRPTTA
ncbi:MAG: DivIVA domain-containing protein [Acidobacteriota bacterium]